MSNRVDDILASMTPAEIVELREKLGQMCLWCGSPATVLCDVPTANAGPACDRMCSAPCCRSCVAKSKAVTGWLSRTNGPAVKIDDTVDWCPACADRLDRRLPTLSRDEHKSFVRVHAAEHQATWQT